MESHPKPTTMHRFCTSSPRFRPNLLSFPLGINPLQKLHLKCAKKGDYSVSAASEELNIEEELKGKCRGIGGGIVELMECLAILGDDEGREATDYSRRALIFDRSSTVFQALKKQQSQH